MRDIGKEPGLNGIQFLQLFRTALFYQVTVVNNSDQ